MSDLKYYSVITDIGRARFANCLITQTPLELTYMAVGDGGGSAVLPKGSETRLAGEVYRGQINYLDHVENDPAQIVAKMTILPNVGGFTIREAGLFDEDDNLIIYASLPTTVKPVLADGSAADYTLVIYALVGNDVDVTIKVDPAQVIATREYVDASIKNHNLAADAHNTTELPWTNCGSCTRTGNSSITVPGDQRAAYPKGKRLRFNGSDTYLCRVFGDPAYTNGATAITVWFDVASTVIPAAVTRLERSRLPPQDTADGREMIGTRDKATIQKLLESYCCGSYTKE